MNNNYYQTCFYNSRSTREEAANVRDYLSALQGYSRQRSARTDASSDVVSTIPLFVRFNQ